MIKEGFKMGNRAIIIFEDEKSKNFSPAIYLHWNGGPESVYLFLDELDHRKVRADQEYEAARFIQIVGEFMDQDRHSGLSLGVSDSPKNLKPKTLESFDPGDNGIYVVCRENGGRRVRRFNCFGTWEKPDIKEADEIAVKREEKVAYKHNYNKKGVFSAVWRTLHGKKEVE